MTSQPAFPFGVDAMWQSILKTNTFSNISCEILKFVLKKMWNNSTFFLKILLNIFPVKTRKINSDFFLYNYNFFPKHYDQRLESHNTVWENRLPSPLRLMPYDEVSCER